MSNINIFDLHPAGYALFTDSESYMHSLSSAETDSIYGGDRPSNDIGDVVGYTATAFAAGLSLAGTPASTAVCAGGAVLASVEAFNQLYD